MSSSAGLDVSAAAAAPHGSQLDVDQQRSSVRTGGQKQQAGDAGASTPPLPSTLTVPLAQRLRKSSLAYRLAPPRRPRTPGVSTETLLGS